MSDEGGGMRIEVGDKVNVYFEYVDYEPDVEVLYTPGSDGDSWHLKRDDGTIVYVQHFCKMVRIKTNR